MELVKNILTSGLGMGTGAISDTVKLVVIGGTVETARRVASSSWSTFIDSFFLTAHFTQEDVPYDWIMHWLSKQPAWGRSREFDITTANAPRGGLDESTGDVEDDDEDSSLGRRRKLVKFMPAYDTTHTIYYRGHWLRITRSKRSTDYGQCREIKISVVARNNTVIKQLVLEAKKMYEKDAEHRIHVFIPDSWGCWRWNGSRQKRPLDSIVLESSVKDMIVADCKDFMNSEDWYAERGIPYRRGYLLYGVPGSGKTSLIHALAGELGLDIYALSLSAKGMSDNTLTQLMGRIPTRCIVLLEDLDASFTHSTTRDSKSTGVPSAQTATQAAESSDGNSLTLSGLLNAIDGVTAPEGRILVATTNHIDRLDEALRRPGRMDVWINFKYATRWQAEGIFKRFFPFVPKTKSGSETPTEGTPTTTDPAIVLSADALKKSKRTSVAGLPVLDEEELNVLAKKFGDAIPEDEISVAGLQGFLLKNKSRPRECVEEVGKWVIEERERRERLKKEKEEKERKEKEEAEKAEKEEKEKKEKEEKEKEKEAAKDTATTTTTTTETPALDVAAARKALRRAKKAALAASALSSPSDTGLPTPPAEAASSASEKSSSDEASTDADSEDEDSSSTSSSSSEEEKKKKTTKKEKKSAKGKEKWVAVKKADSAEDKTDDAAAKDSTNATAAAATATATAVTKEETDDSTEDLSSVDALVDAATKSSPAPAEVAATA